MKPRLSFVPAAGAGKPMSEIGAGYETLAFLPFAFSVETGRTGRLDLSDEKRARCSRMAGPAG